MKNRNRRINTRKDKKRLRNGDMLYDYQYYTRTFDRESDNYKELVNRIGRHPFALYIEGWPDYDIDRLLVGTNCIYHGMQEWKRIDSLDKPYEYNKKQRKKVIEYLVDDNYKIETNTRNFSHNDRKNVWKENELSANVNPVELPYNQYTKEVIRIQKSNNTLGKGVFMLIVNAGDFEYFSVINFTNSFFILQDENYLAGIKPYRNKKRLLKINLEELGSTIEPCFNELLFIMLEAHIRNDFQTIYKYFTEGDQYLIRLQNSSEENFTNIFKELGCSVPLWQAYRDTMEWLMEVIHIDNILLEQKGFIANHSHSYINFIKSVKNDSIFDQMTDMISERCNYYKELETA